MGIFNYVFAVILLLMSALFSGLNLGLLSLGVATLKRKAELGDEEAKRVLPLRVKGNQLLTTLLLGNVAVNSALSIFLADITTGLVGGIVSTVLIVIFGEIVPQAYVSKHALFVGAKTAWITKLYLIIFAPLAYPIGKLLDKTIGEEIPVVFSNDELQAIIREHEENPESPIDSDEESIIIGALTYSAKLVEDIMTPRSRVFTLDGNSSLTEEVINEIKEKNFTRVPVFVNSIDNIVGLLFVKDLIGISSVKRIIDVSRKGSLLKVAENARLDMVLNEFLAKHIHIACVFNKFGEFQGVITLEDIIEEIIQNEVYDEGDDEENPRLQAMLEAKKRLSQKEQVI